MPTNDRENSPQESVVTVAKPLSSHPPFQPLARISHHPSTTAPQWHALTGFPSVGALNVVSATPARPSVAKASHHAPLERLATNGGEICGLGLLLGKTPYGSDAPIAAGRVEDMLVQLPEEHRTRNRGGVQINDFRNPCGTPPGPKSTRCR